MKKSRIFIFILLAAGAAFYFFWDDVAVLYTNIYSQLPQIEKNIGSVIQETGKQILNPPPLRSEKESQVSSLTREGVIKWTNAERIKAGLPELKENLNLDVSAAAKTDDMFKGQYFEHESPSGLGVDDLVEAAGYEFLVIGENLAMGNFENDQDLVLAWMDSPGHRANILNENFEEIGVSVMRAEFDGEMTWIAVQHFGRPISSCTQPSQILKNQIDNNKNEITNLQNLLETLREELQKMSKRNRDLYSQKVEEYNSLVIQYNNLLEQTELLVDKYNIEVSEFNECAAGI